MSLARMLIGGPVKGVRVSSLVNRFVNVKRPLTEFVGDFHLFLDKRIRRTTDEGKELAKQAYRGWLGRKRTALQQGALSGQTNELVKRVGRAVTRRLGTDYPGDMWPGGRSLYMVPNMAALTRVHGMLGYVAGGPIALLGSRALEGRRGIPKQITTNPSIVFKGRGLPAIIERERRAVGQMLSGVRRGLPRFEKEGRMYYRVPARLVDTVQHLRTISSAPSITERHRTVLRELQRTSTIPRERIALPSRSVQRATTTKVAISKASKPAAILSRIKRVNYREIDLGERKTVYRRATESPWSFGGMNVPLTRYGRAASNPTSLIRRLRRANHPETAAVEEFYRLYGRKL